MWGKKHWFLYSGIIFAEQDKNNLLTTSYREKVILEYVNG